MTEARYKPALYLVDQAMKTYERVEV